MFFPRTLFFLGAFLLEGFLLEAAFLLAVFFVCFFLFFFGDIDGVLPLSCLPVYLNALA